MSNLNRTKVRRESTNTMPSALPLGELAFCTDTQELYVGMGNSQLPKKVNKTELDSLLQNIETRMKKGDKISVTQIDKNKGKIDQTYLTDELLQMITGNTPVNSVPANNSITSEKLAPESVSDGKVAHKAIKEINIKKNWGQLLHDDSIVIDLARKEIRTTKDVWYYSDNNHRKVNNNVDFTTIDLSLIDTIGTSGCSHALYYDIPEGVLKFDKLPIDNPHVIFAYWYGGYKPEYIMRGSNETKIRIIAPNGKIYKPNRKVYFGDLLKEHSSGYINITLNPEGNDTISIEGGRMCYSYSGNVAFIDDPHIGENLVPENTPINYVRTIYLNKETGVISMCAYSNFESATQYEDVVVFLHFYRQISGNLVVVDSSKVLEGLVKVNGDWLTQDMLRPKAVKTGHLDDGSVGYRALDRQLRTILRDNSIEVNFQERRVKVAHKFTYVIAENGYKQFRNKQDDKLNDVDIPEEALSSDFYGMYSLWYSAVEGTLNFTNSTEVPSSNSLNLAMFYQGKPFIQNLGDGIRVIDKNGKEVITGFGSVKTYVDTNVNPCINFATIQIGSLNIDSREYKVTCNIRLLVAKGSYITDIVDEVSWADTPNPEYMRFIGIDISTKKLKVFRTREFDLKDNNLVFLCTIYQNKIGHYLSPDNILLNGTNISSVKHEGEIERPIFYSDKPTIEIVHNKQDYTINVTRKKGTYIMFPSTATGGSTSQDGETYVYQCTSANLYYAYKLYVLKSDTTKFLIKNHGGGLTADEQSKYAFVCMFDNQRVFGLNAPANNILLNGVTPMVHHENKVNSDYDWETNRFVIPSDLYLVKDVPYSIFAPNFNMNKLVDNDDCLFEIGLPTKVVQFEQSADIQIPFAYEKGKPFRTRIAGKYKYANSMLTKDINLHVADPSLVKKKQVRVLCIGDSITQSNFPKHLKLHLTNFGIEATMIGSLNNSHESYSYGISQYIPVEKGEGRGGWRLTDFCCNTPLTDGGYYKPNFVMMNPQTQLFDFEYYMRTQGFDGVDYVVINLGTNDMTGYHYHGSVESNSMYGKIRRVDLDTEYLNPESDYYLGKLYDTLINSIHAYDPNIKIGINPPMTRGTTNFIVNSMKWAEVIQNYFKDTPNVYMLGSYLGQGQLSVCTIEGNRNNLFKVSEINDTLKSNSVIADVHVNGMGQLIHTLYPASWIVNMCL